MDVNEIARRVAELAARFGVEAPRVEGGKVPEWCVDGVCPRWGSRYPVLTVGPAFATCSPVEQQGALAGSVVVLDLQRSSRYLPVLVALFGAGVLHTAFSSFAGYAARRGVLPEFAAWQLGIAAVLIYLVGLLIAHSVWSRSIIYRLDRRMVEVLGAELVNRTLDMDERSRNRARGVAGVLVRLAQPGRDRRVGRLGI